MTVSSSTSRIEYTGDAVTTAFSFPYYFLANGDLKVYLDGVLQTITTHYTVAGAGVGAGGTVTFVTAPPNGDVVVIYREVAITQSVDYTPNDPFPANTHEQALDRLTMIAQQLDEEAGRALALPSTSTYSDLTLPDPQANYYLQWKADLSGLQNVATVSVGALAVSPYIETLLNDPDAATARTTLGGVATLDGSTLTTATLTSPVLNGTLSGTAFLDEDAMTSNSAIATVSQQSVKAYVDSLRLSSRVDTASGNGTTHQGVSAFFSIRNANPASGNTFRIYNDHGSLSMEISYRGDAGTVSVSTITPGNYLGLALAAPETTDIFLCLLSGSTQMARITTFFPTGSGILHTISLVSP